jgi:hypothetical protein
MKKSLLIFMLSALAMILGGALTYQAHAQQWGDFRRALVEWEYVTSIVRMDLGEQFSIEVHNDSDADQPLEVLVSVLGGQEPYTFDNVLNPNSHWILSYTVGIGDAAPSAGGYWFRIRVRSALLIPSVTFHSIDSWKPFFSYLPGDFAVFKITPYGTRQRMW